MKRTIIEGPPEAGQKQPFAKSLVWFVALWVASLASVAIVAYALRALIL